NIIYISSKTGHKITEYFEDARVCDAFNDDDVKKCMKRLKEFHNMKLKVNHEFDIFKLINFYEKLWNGQSSIYKDYKETKEKVFLLKNFIEKHVHEKFLTHIDAVPDNFLFTKDENGKEDIRLIDWEYAGMQDPHVDIAMFGIYSLYNRKQMDKLIDFYFEGKCKNIDRIKIYCYVSACGLLWSNWCEFKRNLGVEFGEYSIEQYRYAKNYYKIVEEELKKLGDDK
ncbi:MAG: phosphotransferase, partial [Clostridia bacterium]|nr:phosphotransferase [Clostridia bacterium]